MTRNVRNFWVCADIDGRESLLESGPRPKNGGMTVSISQRNDGGIITDLVHVRCTAHGEELITEVFIAGKHVGTFKTTR